MGIFASIKNIFGNKKTKKNRLIDELQMEITHRDPRQNDSEQFMEFTTFTEIEKIFPQAKRVHFTGWGDPLKHPQGIEMIKKTCSAVKIVDITTHSSSFTQETAEKLAELEINNLTIITHSPLKDLGDELKTITSLLKKGGDYPKVIIDYIMTKENIASLPQLIEVAGDSNFDEVKASNINFILSEELNGDKVFIGTVDQENRGDLIKQGKAKGDAQWEEILKTAEKVADKKGIYFSTKALVPNEGVMCEYSPIKNVYINWQGDLSPCQLLALPGNTKIYFNEQEKEQKPLIVGNITSQSVTDLWQDEQYAHFRNCYQKRVKIFNTYMEETFEEEPNAKLIYNNYQKLEEQLAQEKLPAPCQICYKAYSI